MSYFSAKFLRRPARFKCFRYAVLFRVKCIFQIVNKSFALWVVMMMMMLMNSNTEA